MCEELKPLWGALDQLKALFVNSITFSPLWQTSIYITTIPVCVCVFLSEKFPSLDSIVVSVANQK